MTVTNYQGIVPRLVAQVVDIVVLVILFFLVGFVMSGSFTFEYQGEAAYPFISIYVPVAFLYYILLEGVTGATLGKKLVKIKVVRENGSPCGLGPALVRNILRIVDGLPFLYIIGAILVSRSDKKQRLGDRLAKTVVVKT